MRGLKIFFLLQFTSSLSAQTKQDTLYYLHARARNYLAVVYNEGKVDSVINSWHPSVFENLKAFYKEKYKKSIDSIHTINKFKQDFSAFRKSNIYFSFGNFKDQTIEYNQGVPQVYFQYTYSEIEKGVTNSKESYFYFIYEPATLTWKIIDYRIPEILGKPTLWLK